jgi:HSP20 family protein
MARERSKNREETQSVEPRQRGQVSRWEPWSGSGPFGMMHRFANEMDRMFDRISEGFGLPAMGRFSEWPLSLAASERFSPDVDMYERDGKLVITADLPGLKKDDLKVEVTEDAVLIEGERKYEHEESEEGLYRSERSYGHFRRRISLPEGVKTDTATANFKNGVLEVTLEAPELNKTRRRLQIQEEPGQKSAA